MSLCIDPLHGCAPLGALYAAFGVHGALPLSHGASGCCRFQRMELSKHFQKTVRVPSSLLRDRAAMFGGEPELREAVENVFRLYGPEVLVVCTTCLSETIGDDVEGIVHMLDVPEAASVVWASTPGYAGSPLKGYAATVAALVRQLAKPVPEAGEQGEDGRRLCLLPGWMNPVDVDAAHCYATAFFDRVDVVPDVRGVFDERTPDDPWDYVAGGTPLATLEGLAGCGQAVAFGFEATHAGAQALREVAGRIASSGGCDVREVGLPVGIAATDAFVQELAGLSGRRAPSWLVRARTRAVDCLMQVADRLYGKRALVACDADLAVGLASFLVDAGMVPACVAVGDVEPDFERRLRSAVRLPEESAVLVGVDRVEVEEQVARHPVDLVLGDTRNKRLAARCGVPLVRVGFPVVDRPLAYTEPVAGYEGALSLLRRVANAFCEEEEHGVDPEDLTISRYF